MNKLTLEEEKKARLKSQIKILERLKNEAKGKLDKVNDVNENVNNLSFVTSNSENEISSSLNNDLKIKNELLNFSGIRCTRISKEDYVFQFTVNQEDKKQLIYFVQLLKTRNGLRLGKWNFPMFLDVNNILEESSLETINALSQFLRKCKHYIDCYHHRMNQYINCQNSIKEYTNCIVNRDSLYTYFMIELLQVYSVKMDNYINIIIYLQYELNEVRPYKIKVDSQYGDPLLQETEKDLRSFFKPFKHFDLTEALETVEYRDNSLFSWQRIAKDNTIGVEDLEDVSPPKRRRLSKSSTNKVRKSSLLPKKVGRPKKNQTDIAKYFSKADSAAAVNANNPEKTTKEQSEKEDLANISSPLKETMNLKLKSNVKDAKETQKNELKDPILREKEILEKKRILRSSTNSPKKDISPKKNSPKKGPISKFVASKVRSPKNSWKKNSPKKGPISKFVASKVIRSPKKVEPISKLAPPKMIRIQNKDVSPKKNSPKKVEPINKLAPSILSRKLANIKKLVSTNTAISSETSNVKMKQTSLQLENYDKSALTTRIPIIKLNANEKLLRSKVVTSTPLPVKILKRTRQSLSDFDLSEIKKGMGKIVKNPIKQTIRKPNKIKK